MGGRLNSHTGYLLGVLCVFLLAAGCTKPAESPTVGAGPGANSSAPSTGAQTNDPDGPLQAVVAETLAYAEVDDKLVKGHFVFPEDMVEALPAIILIHEWWGLNADMRALADRYASEGYIVLAIDLFNGHTAGSPADARLLMQSVIENPGFASENLKQACEWVLSTTGATQVATVGYGFGGDWSLTAAIELPEDVDAAVVFYGQVSGDEAVLATLNAPVLGLFGGEDGRIPLASIDAMRTALDNLGKPYEVEIFPNGKGGFATPGSRNFNEHLESISWQRLTAFLRKYLVTSDTANSG